MIDMGEDFYKQSKCNYTSHAFKNDGTYASKVDTTTIHSQNIGRRSYPQRQRLQNGTQEDP